jgi:amidase
MNYTLPSPRRKALKDFRVGVIYTDPVSEVSDDVQAVLHKLTGFLRKQRVKIDEKARPQIDFREVERIFATLLAAATGAREPREQFEAQLKARAALDPADTSFAAHSLRGQTLYHRDWLALHEERARLRLAWHEWFKDYDLLLCPVFPVAPHELSDVPSRQRVYRVNGRERDHGSMLFWAGLTGVAYLPSTAAPAGFTGEGLPVGVQIVGPQFGDRTTIHFAKLLEKEWQGFVPPEGYGA